AVTRRPPRPDRPCRRRDRRPPVPGRGAGARVARARPRRGDPYRTPRRAVHPGAGRPGACGAAGQFARGRDRGKAARGAGHPARRAWLAPGPAPAPRRAAGRVRRLSQFRPRTGSAQPRPAAGAARAGHAAEQGQCAPAAVRIRARDLVSDRGRRGWFRSGADRADRQPGAPGDPRCTRRLSAAVGRRPAAPAGGGRQPGRGGVRAGGAARAAAAAGGPAPPPARVAAVSRRRPRRAARTTARGGHRRRGAAVFPRHRRSPARIAPGHHPRRRQHRGRPAGDRPPRHLRAAAARRLARGAAPQRADPGRRRRGLARAGTGIHARGAGTAAGRIVRLAHAAAGRRPRRVRARASGCGRAPGRPGRTRPRRLRPAASPYNRAMREDSGLQSAPLRDDADVLVVGGGHNGLVCAAYLAAAGLTVTVLERRGVVGGAAVTEEFHPGFRNSTASYTVSLLDRSVIADLQLARHGLRVVERPFSNFLPLPDGRAFRLGGEHGLESIAAWSPRDAERMPAYEAMLTRVVAVLRELARRTPPDVGGRLSLSDWLASWDVARRLGRLDLEGRRDLLELFTRSAGELLDQWFESEPLKA